MAFTEREAWDQARGTKLGIKPHECTERSRHSSQIDRTLYTSALDAEQCPVPPSIPLIGKVIQKHRSISCWLFVCPETQPFCVVRPDGLATFKSVCTIKCIYMEFWG
ncbi:hypothetical protein PILCRDRAFT_557874 [Piloderma croceum F 1598]|uniref:Uncharacterized protein n=1 Tax=Piloderma croceum (strain F 1598) TaxID=765440 RepID=A0A0C3AZS8_PILCF|nr:hypothetical protein PILCRDRAFT_557874 [Piloderma croceum F 1598]